MAERDPSHPDINNPWLVAARTLDAEYEQMGGIEPVAKKFGIDYETLLWVAEQRALRAVLAMTAPGKAQAVRETAKAAERGETGAVAGVPIALTPEQEVLQDAFTQMNAETMMIGIRAGQIKPGDYPEWTGPGSDIRVPSE